MDQGKIGRFIAQCRKNCNLTQEQVAEALGVSNKTVSRWENGNGFPDVSLLQPLCELLHISVNELLAGEKIPEDNYRKKVEENTLRILEECRFAMENGRYFRKSKGSINFGSFGTVAIVFIVLKLTGTIAWSWIWVLSPIWIGLAFCGIAVAASWIVMKILMKNDRWKKHIGKRARINIRF